MRPLLAGLGLFVGLGAAGSGMAHDIGLRPFGSEDELKVWLSAHAGQDSPPCDDPDPMMCPPPEDERDIVESVIITGSRIPANPATASAINGATLDGLVDTASASRRVSR